MNRSSENGRWNATVNYEVAYLESFFARVAKTLALCVVLVVSLVGNILIIVSVSKNTNGRMRTVSNLLIANTSVAYLLITTVNIPGKIAEINTVGFPIGGTLGDLVCALRNSVPFLTVSSSTQSFVILAIDRFVAVYFPLRRISHQSAYILIGITWLTTLIFGGVYAYGSFVHETDDIRLCMIHVSRTFGDLRGLVAYVWVEFTVFSIVPIVLAVSLYTATILKLWRRTTPGRYGLPTPTSYSEKANRSAVKMLTIVLVTFAVPRIPYWVFVIECRGTYEHFLGHSFCSSETFHYVDTFLGYSSCALVPYIYPFYSQNFRAGFKDILRSRCQGRIENGRVSPLRARKTSRRESKQITKL
ncbi:predicted protein [Nematostella vectensis]|uniref:G-protein coupled receptors family 1 profile domain-containing protein n=1 Tax=Nematostella vectensis TaxID=45351 RepID=A7RZN0_NEMVE|nr:predicted protein [Nematostella vectensis]|eukprot:XP_001635191.1 predicted protein [Nematostella vectensis]